MHDDKLIYKNKNQQETELRNRNVNQQGTEMYMLFVFQSKPAETPKRQGEKSGEKEGEQPATGESILEDEETFTKGL